MALKKKKKISVKEKASNVKKSKKSKKVSKSKSKAAVASRTGKKKKILERELKKSKTTSKKSQLRKAKKEKVNLKAKSRPSEKLKQMVKKAGITKSKTQSMEKRKILELKKELSNLDRKNKEAVLIKDAEGRLYCHDENCDQPAVTDIYCRYHYLALWKYLQVRTKLLENRYIMKTIQDLMKTFGTGIINILVSDFKNEKTFEVAAREMSFSTEKEEEIISSETDTHF